MATIADELNAISVGLGYTGPAPKTIAGAIDALTDTLAGTDVEERRTIAGAVKALAPYIGSGGGGSLGGMQHTPSLTFQRPAAGDPVDLDYAHVASLYVGNQQVLFPTGGASGSTITALAAGSRITLVYAMSDEPSEVAAYVATPVLRSAELVSELVYESVEPWDGEYAESHDGQLLSLTVTVPELDYADDEMLLFYVVEA